MIGKNKNIFFESLITSIFDVFDKFFRLVKKPQSFFVKFELKNLCSKRDKLFEKYNSKTSKTFDAV